MCSAIDTNLAAAPCCQSSLVDPQPHAHSFDSLNNPHLSHPDQHQQSQGDAVSYNPLPCVWADEINAQILCVPAVFFVRPDQESNIILQIYKLQQHTLRVTTVQEEIHSYTYSYGK